MSFYVERDGRLAGPFSAEKLKKLASTGKIHPQDYILDSPHKKKRVIASQVSGLLPAADQTPASDAQRSSETSVPVTHHQTRSPKGIQSITRWVSVICVLLAGYVAWEIRWYLDRLFDPAEDFADFFWVTDHTHLTWQMAELLRLPIQLTLKFSGILAIGIFIVAVGGLIFPSVTLLRLESAFLYCEGGARVARLCLIALSVTSEIGGTVQRTSWTFIVAAYSANLLPGLVIVVAVFFLARFAWKQGAKFDDTT